jgi:hypothetical protein
MPSSKKIYMKRDFAAGVYLLRHTLPYTLYTCIKYTYLHRKEGMRGRVEPVRRLEGQQFTKLDRKYQHD